MKRFLKAVILSTALGQLQSTDSTLAAEQVIAVKPVQIVTSSNPDMFPKRWQTKRVSASGKSVSKEQYERIRLILDRATQKYPPEVLHRHLRKIYVLSELKYLGIEAAGTNSSLNDVYLGTSDGKVVGTDDQIEGVFHAEFSSILLRNCPQSFNAEAWQKINPPGFKYLGNGVKATKQKKAGTDWRDDLQEQGFLNEYGQSSMENDFNGLAELAFMGDAALWERVDRFPRLRQKMALTVAFYHRINRAFTEAYFRSLVGR